MLFPTRDIEPRPGTALKKRSARGEFATVPVTETKTCIMPTAIVANGVKTEAISPASRRYDPTAVNKLNASRSLAGEARLVPPSGDATKTTRRGPTLAPPNASSHQRTTKPPRL